jgi:hypothetical protein
MRRTDDSPIDPEIAASLDAIDATLAGEPVDPKYAELAETALLLVVDRPQMDPAAANSLDERVKRRFASQPTGDRKRRSRRGWLWAPLGGSVVAVAAAVAVVFVVSQGGSGGPSGTSAVASSAASASPTRSLAGPAYGAAGSATTAGSSAGGSSAGGAVAAQAAPGSARKAPAAPTPANAQTLNGPTSNHSGSAPFGTLQPPNNGRKITQSAQLSLSAPPNRIDDVAQQVFEVAGAQNAIVNSSEVTATGGPDGYAQFQLSVPSSNLGQTMKQLSQLKYASVVSRTDTTQDVNNQFVSANHRLADAQALRTSLLKQLANAVTQAQIDSLNAQIHDAEATIGGIQAQLRGLNHQVDFSQVTVSINAGAIPVPVNHSGFTLGKAAHDAGRVLTVAAGVALIVLAALVPLGLLIALAWWIAIAIRRRQREQALDSA